MLFNRKSFLRTWRAALDERAKRHNATYSCWEGGAAYDDLKRKGLLSVIEFERDMRENGSGFKGEQDRRSKSMFRNLRTAVALYEADAKRIQKEPLRAGAANALRTLRVLSREKHSREIKKLTSELLELLESEISAKHAVYQYKRDKAFFRGLPGLSHALKEHVTAPLRGYDLDARFQVKIGFLLNFQLRGFSAGTRDISLRTISRLVVLFYIASGLATYAPAPLHSKQIQTVLTQKSISVRAVDLNLRRAKLNELDSPKSISQRDRFWLK